MSEAVELLDSLAKQGVVFWGEGSRLRYRASSGTLTEAARSQLASRKEAVLDAWCERAAQTVISRPAGHGQRGSWFLHQSKPESGAYNIVFSARVRSAINVPALRRSFQALVDRHPSLRTTFSDEADGLVQRTQGWMPVCFAVHDRSAVELPQLRDEIYKASQAPFDLRNGPLMRVDLFQRSADDHVLLVTVHHIAADGWSMFLLLYDLGRIYPAECNGGAAYPSRPTCDILQHAQWQSAMLAGPEGEEHEAYWLRKLAGIDTPLNMPTDRPRSVSYSVQGASLPIDLGINLSDAVRALAAREGATPFMVLLTAYQILLHRYTGDDGIIVGSPVYGRHRQEFADVVGLFINMIPLRATYNDDPSVQEALARVRQAVVEGIQHQDYPFPLLVEKLRPNRDFSRTPVFQTVFNLQKYPQVGGLEAFLGNGGSEERAELGGLELEIFPIPQQEGQLELSVELTEKDGAYQGVMKYDRDLFDASTMRRFLNHYATLLRSMAKSPGSKVSELPLLERTEREWLVAGLNATDREYPRERTVVDLIREQAVRRPEAKAVTFDAETLTYAELDIQSTRLARHIRSFGIGPESLVGVCLERGLEMVIGALAVLKAGAAYVALDPAFPADRLRYMVEDSGAKLLITQSVLSEALFSGLDLVSVFLDNAKDQIDQESNEPLPPLAGPPNRAYVLYTSGSTGRPKAVEIEHRSLTNFLCSMAQEPGMSEKDVLLAVTTLAFDIAGLELFLPLITGAQIALASRETAMDGAALAHKLTTSGATVMQATPATWRMLFDSGWRGDRNLKVLCGGEAMDRELATRLVSACGSVWNMYGPTETTIWSSLARIESDDVTIGRPVANTRMYVLDQHREPVPRGVVGELWIAGDGVARGYLNRADLTAERFVPDPFQQRGIIYRTGDVARYLSDGRLEYLGRKDNQVKIRGYRIELDEITTVLSSHPNVRECVVAAQSEYAGQQRLTAYVVAATPQLPLAADLQSFLRTTLPEYMIPSSFAFIDAIPLSPNGKVNRKALPAIARHSLDVNPGYVAPRNRIEQTMADIWGEVLGLENVGIYDHFFELGGHSLLAARLIARLKSAFQVELPLKSLFIDPTVASLSKHIIYDDYTGGYYHVGENCRWNRLIPAQPKGSKPPLFLVAGYSDADDTLRVLSRIIPYLGLDQPVYGFQPRWLDGQSNRYASAKEAALEFLTDLKAFRPKGPYILGGDCVGGIVALLMAEELLSQGEEVSLLALFDTTRPSALFSVALDLYYYGWLNAKHVAGLLYQLIRSDHSSRIQLLREIFRRKFGPSDSKTEAERETYKLVMDYMRTVYRHRLKSYPGKITLIVNEKQWKFYKYMGWRGVPERGLEVHSIPGDHRTRYLHGKELAERLVNCMRRYGPECIAQNAK